jgi:hypothetical protein
MNQITSCQSKAISLNQILTSSSTQLPVYTRFQKTDLYLTVPVMSLQVSKEGIEVYTASETSIRMNFIDLQDIVAFRDAAGKVIFLKNFEAESRYAEDLIAENEKLQDEWHRTIQTWQKRYIPSDDCVYVPADRLLPADSMMHVTSKSMKQQWMCWRITLGLTTPEEWPATILNQHPVVNDQLQLSQEDIQRHELTSSRSHPAMVEMRNPISNRLKLSSSTKVSQSLKHSLK